MRRNLFWLSDDHWRRIKPLLPTDVRGKERVDDRRVHQRHPACPEERLPMVRLSTRVRAPDDDLQSVRALGGARRVGEVVPRSCDPRSINRDLLP